MFRKRGTHDSGSIKNALNMMVDACNQPITVSLSCQFIPMISVCVLCTYMMCNDEGRIMAQSTFNRFFDGNFVYE